MSHIKLLSVPVNWSINDIISGLKRVFNWEREENEIKLIHFEKLKNGRQHVRMNFIRRETIIGMINAARTTKDKNIKSIELNNNTILFQILNNADERFKITAFEGKQTAEELNVLAIACPRVNDKKIIIDELDKFTHKVQYISHNFNNCFLKFFDNSSCQKYAKFLASREFRFKFSKTVLKLLNYQIRDNKPNLKPRKIVLNNNQHDKKKQYENNSSHNVIPKLLETVTNISNNLDRVIENQNNLQMHNNSIPSNVGNIFPNRNLLTSDNNALVSNNSIEAQYQMQLMYNMMRMHQFFNRNSF